MNLIQNIFQNPNFKIEGDRHKLKKRILKDIINMNWFNDCDLLIGYKDGQREYTDPKRWQLDAANSLFEFYWNYTVDRYTNYEDLENEIYNHMRNSKYIGVQTTVLPKFTIPYRADKGQCMIDENGKQTFRDGTPTRPFYSLIYIAQNGFIDFDDKVRLKDWNEVVKSNPKYLKYFETCIDHFDDGENNVKKEIRDLAKSYKDFREYLDETKPILEDRKWLYDFCADVEVKCDPYKNYEAELLKKNGFIVMGGNEFIYYNDIVCVNCGKPHYRNGLCRDCCEMNFKDRMIGNKLYGNVSQTSNSTQQDAVKLAGAASSASSGSFRVSDGASRQGHSMDDESVLQASTNAISSRASRAAGESMSTNVGTTTSGNSATIIEEDIGNASSTSRTSFASRASGLNVGITTSGNSTSVGVDNMADAGNTAVKSNASKSVGYNIEGTIVSSNTTGISTAVAEERMSDASHTAVASKVSRMPGQNVGEQGVVVGNQPSGQSHILDEDNMASASGVSVKSIASRAAGMQVGTQTTSNSETMRADIMTEAGHNASKSASNSSVTQVGTTTSANSTSISDDSIGSVANVSVSSGSTQSRGLNVGMQKPSANSSVIDEETLQFASHDSRVAAFTHTSGASNVTSNEDVQRAGLESRTAGFQTAVRAVNISDKDYSNSRSRVVGNSTSGDSHSTGDNTVSQIGMEARTSAFQTKFNADNVSEGVNVGTTTSRVSNANVEESVTEAGMTSRTSITTSASAVNVGTTTSELSFARNKDTVDEAGKASRSSITTSPSATSTEDVKFIGNIKDFVYTSPNTVRYYSSQGKIFDMTIPNGYKYPDNISTNRFFMFGSFNGNLELLKQFCPQNAFVFDPFAGHGDRALFFMEYGCKAYIGNDTNENEWEFLNNNLIKLINKYKRFGQKCEVRIKNSMIYEPELENKVDFVYTSPPYFDFEMYDGFTEQIAGMKTYDDFHREFSVPIFTNVYKYMKDGGVVILQTEKDKRLKQKWIDMMESVGFRNITENDLSNAQKHGINKTIQEIGIFVKGDYNRAEAKQSSNTLF